MASDWYEDDYRRTVESVQATQFLPCTNVEIVHPPDRRRAPQHVLFDFDGTLIDANELKEEAFARLFENEGAAVREQALRFAARHGGISRYRMIPIFGRELLGRAYSEQEVNALADRYSELVMEEILDAPFMPGAEAALRLVRQSGVPAFVVSGTPEGELRRVVERRGLAGFFKGVFGSPRSKEEIIFGVLERWGIAPSSCLFVGDAIKDFVAARETGVNFLGVVPRGCESPFPPGASTCERVRLDV
jgi:phosphoglycolate phosphatase-like HAD superfamily hydrolase